MARLIPSEGGSLNNKQNKPEWFDIDALDKAASKEIQERSKIKANVSNKNKQVVVSRVCNSCHKVFSESGLNKQKKEAVRSGQSFIACPNCNSPLKVYKTTTIAEKPHIQSVVKLSLNREPGRVPNTWLDKAHYGRMVHELGKFCKAFNITSPQIRFQRGIRARHDNNNNSPGSAEFSIDYIDKSGTRSRIYTTVGLTQAGEFVAPKTFYLASGKTFPFTAEALDELSSGKLFNPVEVQIPQARLNYRDPDFTRFPHTWSKKVDKMKKTAARPEVVDAVNKGLTFEEAVVDVPGITREEYDAAASEVTNKPSVQTPTPNQVPIVPTAADTMLQPGQIVNYQGRDWVFQRWYAGDSILIEDPDTGEVIAVPPGRQNEVRPTGTWRIGSFDGTEIRKLAVDELNDELNKEAARDEDTYIPLVESDPDYSIAEQSQRSEKPFNIPYSEMDQGVLPEEERGYTTMFRANQLNLKKYAGRGAKDQALWDRAEKAVDKSKYDEDTYWKIVSSVYQKMGGEFNESTTARNLNKTGPKGEGPGTGRGKGICTDEEKKVDKKATIKHEDGKWKVYNEAETKLLGTIVKKKRSITSIHTNRNRKN